MGKIKLARMREGNDLNGGSRQTRREAILAALAKSTGEAASSTDFEEGDNGSYYTLTREDMEALLNGNIEKIESWVSTLDRRHATWLLRWLIKESG